MSLNIAQQHAMSQRLSPEELAAAAKAPEGGFLSPVVAAMVLNEQNAARDRMSNSMASPPGATVVDEIVGGPAQPANPMMNTDPSMMMG